MSADVVIEDVPPFVKRMGDQAIQGSNNTLVVLGTDRATNGPAGLSSGLGSTKSQGGGKGTGTIHIVAGRKSADPDFSVDSSFVYVSAKTRADENLSLPGKDGTSNDLPSIVAKSDVVRVVARKDVKLAIDGGNEVVLVKKAKIQLRVGENVVYVDDKTVVVDIGGSSTLTIKGNSFVYKTGPTSITADQTQVVVSSPKVAVTGGASAPREAWHNIVKTMIENHIHMTAVGPTTPASAGPTIAVLAPLTPGFEAFKNATLK